MSFALRAPTYSESPVDYIPSSACPGYRTSVSSSRGRVGGRACRFALRAPTYSESPVDCAIRRGCAVCRWTASSSRKTTETQGMALQKCRRHEIDDSSAWVALGNLSSKPVASVTMAHGSDGKAVGGGCCGLRGEYGTATTPIRDVDSASHGTSQTLILLRLCRMVRRYEILRLVQHRVSFDSKARARSKRPWGGTCI